MTPEHEALHLGDPEDDEDEEEEQRKKRQDDEEDNDGDGDEDDDEEDDGLLVRSPRAVRPLAARNEGRNGTAPIAG